MTLFDPAVPRSPGRRGEAPNPPASTESIGRDNPNGTRPAGGSRNRRDRAFAQGDIFAEWLTHWQYAPGGRELVYMLRATNGKVRFYAWTPATEHHAAYSRVIGRPEHDSIVAAYHWAYFHGWQPVDADEEWARGCRLEVLNHSTFKGPEDRCGCGGGDKPWHVGIPEVIARRRIEPDPILAGRVLDGRTWDEWPGCTGEETR